MNANRYLDELTKNDIYSLMLFVLYQNQKIPEHAALSELIYVLDRPNLLKLCQYFGGETLKIPTIDELKYLILSLNLYQQVNIEKKDLEQCINSINEPRNVIKIIKQNYNSICDIMSNVGLNNV